LRRDLGKLELGEGTTVEERLKDFVLERASEGELYRLIQFVPAAVLLGFDDEVERTSRHYRPWDFKRPVIGDIVVALNSFLEQIALPARFDAEGILHIEGIADDAPRQLLALPNREVLIREVSGQLLSGSFAVSIVFIDLDGFKAVNDARGHDAGNGCLERAVH